MKDPAKNTLMRYAYAYDAAGNITVKNTEHGNYAYGYDVQDRLTSAAYPTSSETFAYDKVGNRIAHNGGSPWTYNANNALTARPAITYQYDANGSQIKKTEGATVTDYIYNGENRLTQIKQGATTLASYAYDPFGRRISKTVNGTTTYYFYNDEGLTAEADSTGAVQVSYGYAPNSTWGTDPLYMRVNGTYHYYLNDHLGTPQQLAMKNGATTWSAIYEAFGKATVTSSSITNNLRFPGQYADSETGLHYNMFRTYDHQTGRYIMVDLAGLNGGNNSYIYAGSAPITVTDNLGLFAGGPIIGPGGIGRGGTPGYSKGPFGPVCGSGPSASWIPDGFFGYDFTPACQQHDDCYGDCKTPKAICDLNLLIGTKSLLYFFAVSGFGDGPFKDARKDCPNNDCSSR
jgi:RHS repeat-associated protein